MDKWPLLRLPKLAPVPKYVPPRKSITFKRSACGFLVMMLMIPPGWAWPYSTDVGPFITSIRSTLTVEGELKRAASPGSPLYWMLPVLDARTPRMTKSTAVLPERATPVV